MSVNDSSALEDTLERLRQRYTLYFSLPEGVQPGEERNIEVDLTPETRRLFRTPKCDTGAPYVALKRPRHRTHQDHPCAERQPFQQCRSSD